MYISSFHDKSFEGKYQEFVYDLGLLWNSQEKKKQYNSSSRTESVSLETYEGGTLSLALACGG